MSGHVFRVGSPSFFQVNTPQAERMVDIIREELELSGDEVVADVYAGVGTFAALLAPHCGRVLAIEESSAALDDARVNCEGISNLELCHARAEDALEAMEQCPDAIVLDPPRAGCHPSMLESMVRLRPRKIVYVSCDPATLARDLKVLCAGGFQLRKVQPIDMFPQTHHVECVATLTASDVTSLTTPLTLASASPRRRELLQALDMEFRVQPSSIPEEPVPGESPVDLVRRLALAKAQAVASEISEGLVVGADSVVVHQGTILGKPETVEEARRMLSRLRGNTHQVFSGVAVVDAATGAHQLDCETTSVMMRDYSDAEMDAYIASGSPMDKAGAYGVQDGDFHPASAVQGCYSNVVGLPLCTLLRMLKEMGYDEGPHVPDALLHDCTNCPLRGEQRP
jgi:23S rRNA (uracil1939-C5)-methyltransferase